MKRKKIWSIRFAALLIILTALIAAGILFVNAHFVRKSEEVTNSFTPAVSVNPDIKETFENNVKENVSIKIDNIGYPVYVRAMIVITWQKADGTVWFTEPIKGSDYTLDLNTIDWEYGDDGYYYYNKPVKSGGETAVLIKSCRQIEDAPAEGYTLSVEIIAETVQAVGYTDDENIPAYQDAWNLKDEIGS